MTLRPVQNDNQSRSDEPNPKLLVVGAFEPGVGIDASTDSAQLDFAVVNGVNLVGHVEERAVVRRRDNRHLFLVNHLLKQPKNLGGVRC